MKNLLLVFLTIGVIFAGCNSEETAQEQAVNTTDAAGHEGHDHEGHDHDGEMLSTEAINNPNSTTGDVDPANAPVMSFDKANHDFGTMKQGEKVQFNFKFTNTGNSDLIITNASATCGCTVPTYPKEPIKPGGTGIIPVEFSSGTNTNKVSKQVTITANTVPSQNKLTIEAFVEPK